MQHFRSFFVGVGLLCAAMALSSAPAFAQGYPGATVGTRLVAPQTGYGGELSVTAGSTYGRYVFRGLKIVCTTAGNVAVTYPDNSTGVWPVAVGTTWLPLNFISVNTSGTTAVATYFGLR